MTTLSGALVIVSLALWLHAGEGHDAGRPTPRGAWLTALPDHRPLTELSLPGTHDTMTATGGAVWWLTRPLSRTQSWSLTEQLDAGVRSLDIRVRGDLRLVHGWVPLRGDLAGVLAELDAFLAEQPGETILLRLRDDDGSSPRLLRAELAPLLDRHGARLWAGGSVADITLGELRGKILVLDDTGWPLGDAGALAGAGIGLPWAGAGQRLQDDYAAPRLDDKAAAVAGLLRESGRPHTAGELVLNHVSATATLRTPARYAARLNPRVTALLSGGAGGGRTGVLILDFPDSELLGQIIARNPA